MKQRCFSALFIAQALISATFATVNIRIDAADSLWVISPQDAGFDARPPVNLALRDIKRDWYKVMGSPPPVIISDACGIEALPKGFNGTAFFFGAAAKLCAKHTLAGEEEYEITYQNVVAPGGDILGPLLISAIGGSHIRGEIYAIYAISERLLGVDPLFWWTDSEPEFRGGSITIEQENIAYRSGEPRFRQRGIFPNDEDLLGG